MKKVLVFLSGILFILACNNTQQPPAPQPKSGSLLASDTIARSRAMAMIQHYKDSNVNHGYSSIIKFFKLNDALLDKLRNNKVFGAKFFTAAYLNSEGDTSLRNRPTILMQLKVETNSFSFYYYDIGSQQVCPPPTDCSELTLMEEL